MTKRKIIGIVLLALGVLGVILTIKMVKVDNVGSMEALQSAICVEGGVIDPANEGKIVIVSDTFSLTKPAYDETTGIPIENIHIKCFSQKLDYEKNDPKKFEDEEDYKIRRELEWVSGIGYGFSNGEGTVGAYELSQEFIDTLGINGDFWKDYDVDALNQLGYFVYEDIEDRNASPKKYLYFIEPLTQGDELEKDFIRYYFKVSDIEDGEMVTAVGIQEGNTLKKAPGISESFMKGVVTKDEIMKQNESSQKGSVFGCIFICLLLFVSGGNFLLRKKTS